MRHPSRRRLPVTAALIAALASGIAAPAPAASDPPDPDLPDPSPSSPDSLGWSGTADLGFTLTSGNSETTSLSLGTSVTREFRHQHLGFSGSYLRSTDDGEETANRGEAGIQYRYFPGPRFYFTARGSGGFNEPAGLDLRLAPGAGAGYVLARGDAYELTAEAGANWIRDEFTDGTSETSVFFSAGQSFSLDLTETTSLTQELRYRPNSSDLSDYLLHAEATLTAQVTGGVGLRVTFIDDFDSTPFSGGPDTPPAEENDLTFITGVNVAW